MVNSVAQKSNGHPPTDELNVLLCKCMNDKLRISHFLLVVIVLNSCNLNLNSVGREKAEQNISFCHCTGRGIRDAFSSLLGQDKSQHRPSKAFISLVLKSRPNNEIVEVSDCRADSEYYNVRAVTEVRSKPCVILET